MYEYVSRKEYSPIRAELNKILQKANSYLLKNTDIHFEHRLVGSGSRGLVTRIVGGNQGYDLDFNLVLDAPKGFINDAEQVKRSMMDAFQYAVKGTGWSDPKDSTSVMTIKVVDKKNKRIQYGCDLAIVYYDFRGEMYYLHNYKDYRGYQFVHKSNARDIDSSVDTICDYYENGWNLIREEYLLLKNNNNDPNKKSFMLYIEAVNNVYHQMLCEQDDDDDDWWDDDDY